jgi:hypothetical protein
MVEKVLLSFEDRNMSGEYRDYFIEKRKNYEVVIRDIPELWSCFQKLDEIWARAFSNLQIQTNRCEVLMGILFRHAHGNFRIAFELSFSLAINQSWNLVRTSIDATVIAYKFHREPSFMKIWLNKDKGPNELKEYKKHFENERRANLFPAGHGLDELYKFYRFCSEIGSHPGLGSIALRVNNTVEGNKTNLNFTYLEANAERIPSSIFMVLKPYVLMESVFFSCFKPRLHLDPKLDKMRSEFQQVYNHAAKVVHEQFNQAPQQ